MENEEKNREYRKVLKKRTEILLIFLFLLVLLFFKCHGN